MSNTEDSQRRLANSRIIPKYWWFEGKDLKGLFQAVQERGPENVRLIITPGLDADGRPDLHLGIRGLDDDLSAKNGNGDDWNVSHPCPPDCG